MSRLAWSFVAIAVASGAAPALAQDLTLYAGRGESLVDPLVQQFENETGVSVNVRYAGTAELAVLLQEEGDATPADVFWAQDAGALGAIADSFAPLPAELLDQVPEIFQGATDRWIATSGRARTLAYSTERVDEAELPGSILDLTDEAYQGRVGWAPTNASFQAHVTAMRLTLGEEETRAWLEGMQANDAQIFRNNTAQVQGVADGDIDFGLVNNYYLLRFLADDPDFPVAQTFFDDGDVGNLMNVAGAGILAASDNQEVALQFVEFLLSEEAQTYFTQEVNEYPVIEAVEPNEALASIEDVVAAAPEVELDALEDLESTLELLREVGLL